MPEKYGFFLDSFYINHGVHSHQIYVFLSYFLSIWMYRLGRVIRRFAGKDMVEAVNDAIFAYQSCMQCNSEYVTLTSNYNQCQYNGR